jgi:hypothetical protein
MYVSKTGNRRKKRKPNGMTFNTIEEMAAFYDENKEDYTLSFGSDGAHLRNRSDYTEVAFVRDDRAAAVALNLLADMMPFGGKE